MGPPSQRYSHEEDDPSQECRAGRSLTRDVRNDKIAWEERDVTTDALADTASVSIDGLPDALGRDRSTLAPVREEKYRWTKGMLRAGVTAILLTVCGGCHTPTYLEDLATPALVWTQGGGLCSKILAVDAGRAVRVEQGCENGRPDLRYVRTIGEAELADLWGQFEALPFDQSATIQMCAGSLHHSFARWEAEPRRAAAACSTSHQYDDLSGLPEGFVPLAETLRSLQ